MTRLLVLRPEPGASATVEQARSMGLQVVACPLFETRALAWSLPDPLDVDAVLVTSAAALRHGGTALACLTTLPLYAVGRSSAKAARNAGFRRTVAGTSDAAEILALAEADGVRRILHLAGRDHRTVATPVEIIRRLVYAAEPIGSLDAELLEDTLPLLHSPRAAERFATLFDATGLLRETVPLAALSPAVAKAAGPGWAEIAVPPEPTDAALLAVASRLCEQARQVRPRG